MNQASRRFAVPKRVDDAAGTAIVITETIVSDILYSHLFVADLTFANAGVLLETGIAMGLKPNPQIILITQGDVRDLHFDIRNNNVMSYNPNDAVFQIAKAMISAAQSFEADADRLIESVKRTLTADAVTTLRLYGIMQLKNPAQSLHERMAKIMFNENRPSERFEQVARELLQKRLIYTDYKVGVATGSDQFGMHATDLGWVLIGRMWPDFARKRDL